jgi:hypothetical protein
MTVGVLVTAIALSMLQAAWRRHVTLELRTLAVAAALGLTAVDVIYVSRGVILPVYLIDAAAELVLVVAWAVVSTASWRAGGRGSPG